MVATSWTDKVSVVSVQKVANGATARGTLNLNNKFGAYIFIRVGRLGTTAPATGVRIFVRRIVYDSSNARDIPHPGSLASFQDNTTAAVAPTISSISAGPPGTMTVSSATGVAADQYICITDNTTTPTRAEWHHISKIASTTVTLDKGYANIANSDTLTTQALTPPAIWVDGGPNTTIEVIFDYGAEANSIAVVVEAWAQTLDTVG